MQKAIAVLRSIFLVFIAGFTIWGMPIWGLTRTFDEQYARCSYSLTHLTRAAWLAIAWIALETALGWLSVARQARKAAP